jgi:hypothetical protein
MGEDIKKAIAELIEAMKGFNNNPEIVNQRAKAIVITKLEEAGMWFDRC